MSEADEGRDADKGRDPDGWIDDGELVDAADGAGLPGSPAEAAAGGDLRISRRLTLPAAELSWRFSRAGGPGGQHVNRSETRVELRWSVAGSGVLTEAQRAVLLDRLAGRLDGEGALRIVSSESRSQRANRRVAAERLQSLLAEALRPVKARRGTKPSKAARERRLRAKRERSERKAERGRKDWG